MANCLLNYRRLVRSAIFRARRFAHEARIRAWRILHELPETDLCSEGIPLPPIPEPLRDDICIPPFGGPKDHDDYTPLMSVAISLQPRVVIELGTAHGNTVANICRACENAYVFTVNAPVEEQSGVLVTYQLARADIGRVYRAHGFANRVTQILCNTLDLDLSSTIAPETAELAIIDACHDTDYVLNDFLKVKEFIRPGGVCLFHDTHPSMADHLEGSYMACMQLRRLGFEIKHLRHTWWGFWRKPLSPN
jgi:hypothetical protein